MGSWLKFRHGLARDNKWLALFAKVDLVGVIYWKGNQALTRAVYNPAILVQHKATIAGVDQAAVLGK